MDRRGYREVPYGRSEGDRRGDWGSEERLVHMPSPRNHNECIRRLCPWILIYGQALVHSPGKGSSDKEIRTDRGLPCASAALSASSSRAFRMLSESPSLIK